MDAKVLIAFVIILCVMAYGLFVFINEAADDRDPVTKKKPTPVGGYVNYTRDDPRYQMLSNLEKMDYAFYMMQYNVEERREIPYGKEEAKKVYNPRVNPFSVRFQELFRLESPLKAMIKWTAMIMFFGVAFIFVLILSYLYCMIAGASDLTKDTIKNTLFFVVGLMVVLGILTVAGNNVLKKLSDIGESL